MSFKEIKLLFNKLSNENYRDYIKAIISIETNIEDEDKLDDIYEKYMENDDLFLLDERFNDLAK